MDSTYFQPASTSNFGPKIQQHERWRETKRQKRAFQVSRQAVGRWCGGCWRDDAGTRQVLARQHGTAVPQQTFAQTPHPQAPHSLACAAHQHKHRTRKRHIPAAPCSLASPPLPLLALRVPSLTPSPFCAGANAGAPRRMRGFMRK